MGVGGVGGRTFKGSERCGSFISTLLAAQSGLSPGLRLLFRVASLSFTTRSSRCWELAVGISTGAVEVQDFENHLFHLGSRRLTTLRTFDRRDPCGHMLLWIRQSQKWTDLSLHHRKNVSTETFLESPEIRRHRADGGRAPRTFRRPSGSRRPSYCARRPPEVPGFDHSERLADLPAPLHPVLDDLVLALELGLLLPGPRACLLLESRRRSRDHRGALAFFPLPALPPVSRADASRWVAVNDPEGLVFVVCLPVSRPDESWCWVLVPEPLPVRVSPLPATRPLASR